ncbi:MAG TPA: hypothetical protein DCW42_01605 [Bacteroidetes bacterium]|nr:hypothetical protein [Bacteroidota bacterium]
MKAVEAKLLEFLRKSPQFIIPIYQRTYSWGISECQQLWEDIIRTGSNEKIYAHFIGSIVYIQQGIYSVSATSPLLVIDGQQRLTTISLILEALARRVGNSEPIDGFSAKKIRHYYLLNPLEDAEKAFKLILTQTDKDSLLALLKERNWPSNNSLRIKENFEFFEEKIKALGNELDVLCDGLSKLMIVDLSLTHDVDNPQLIFESMNSTGRELSQADLIRNYILMGLQPNHQTRLYQEYWRPMELSFGQVAYDEHFDGFMRHYLTIKTGKIPRIRDVYKAFKAYSKEPEISDLGVDELVKDIYLFSTYFCAMALGKEKDKGLAEAFRDLRDLKVDVAYPFLLELYHDYKNGSLTKQELIEVVRLVESYVFRRVVCNIPPNSLNKTFATFGRFLRKEKYVESVKANFQLLPSYRRFPNDNEFERDIKVRDLYNFRSRSYWLRRLENYRRKEVVVVPEYTIEHIMPQNENLSLAWQNDLGPDWKTVQKTWLHTLGNLTLTGYNPEYSDRPFCEKRLMEGGFKDSPLQLNKDVKETEIWNEKAINRRADRLAKIATKVWIMPDLSKDIVDKYSDISKRTSGFRIEDHIQLSHSSAMRPVFEILRKDILNIDPVVTEEFLKLYVAYKAETNFTDVVPQANALRVTLNLPFQNIDDPRRICKDVSNVGRWGNGDVEFKLSSVEEIPYAISLIEQSFEYQMGNGKEE